MGWGGVLRISSDTDNQRFFFEFEIFDSGIFLASIVLVALVLVQLFLGSQNSLKMCGSTLVSRPRIS